MKRNLILQAIAWRLLITGFVLQACTGLPGDTLTQIPSATFAPSKFPSSTSTEEACGYVWAYEELPDLSKLIQDKLEPVQTNVIARAQAFGEDCVYPSGRSEFHALETDFYVTLVVKDLSNENELGNWISKIMPVLISIPPAQLKGPKDGFCEFLFIENDNELRVRVPIEQFRSQAKGLEGAELFRLFAGKPN